LIWGLYLVLASIYCLLAFLPDTYFALIKAPAYAWMPWFGLPAEFCTGWCCWPWRQRGEREGGIQ
jgi:hypothetical protein